MENNKVDTRYITGAQSVDAISEEQPRDLQGQIEAVKNFGHRLSRINHQLSAQISRLYGEGEPPANETKGVPQPVGLHHEMSIALAQIESALSNIEGKTDRLSRYA